MAFEEVSLPLLHELASQFTEQPNDTGLKGGAKQRLGVPRQPCLKTQSIFDLDNWMLHHFPEADGPRPFEEGGRIWVLPVCVFRPSDGRTMFVAQLASGAISAGCHHATCPGSRSTGNHWSDLRDLVGDVSTGGTAPTEKLDSVATLPTIPPLRPLIEHLICGPDLEKAQFPVREALISPWLTTASLSMVYAPTGVGKTWFVMEQIRAMTKGTPFLGWAVNRPCRHLGDWSLSPPGLLGIVRSNLASMSCDGRWEQMVHKHHRSIGPTRYVDLRGWSGLRRSRLGRFGNHMSKRTPGSKYQMKIAKKKYDEERERYRSKLRRRRQETEQ